MTLAKKSMTLKPQWMSSGNQPSEPMQTFDQFFEGKAFREAVKQSDRDQKEMIRQADRIIKNGGGPKTNVTPRAPAGTKTRQKKH